MGTQTDLRPNANYTFHTGDTPTVFGGASSGQAALQDDTDTTGVDFSSPSSSRYPLSTFTLPTGALVDWVQVFGRWATGSGATHFSLWIGLSGREYANVGGGPAGDTWKGLHSGLGTRYGTVKHSRQPNGSYWDQPSIDDLGLRYELWNDSLSGTMFLYEMGLLVGWYARPNVDVTGFSGTTQQTNVAVAWTFDGDGLGQAYYQVKVFTQAQYTKAGFDPETAVPFKTAGVQKSSSRKVTFSGFNDGTYRAYVRAAQILPQSGRQQWSAWDFTTFTVDRAPNAPKITAPDQGQRFDTGLGVDIQWKYSHPDPRVGQSTYAIGRRMDAGTWEYWNEGGGTWQPTVVHNAGAATHKAFGAGVFPSGHTWDVRVEVKDADGDLSPFSPTVSFVGDAPPSVSVDSPSGIVTFSSNPGVSWTFTDPDGDTQEVAEISIFADSVFNEEGFVPDDPSFEPAWTSGQFATTLDSIDEISTSLGDGNTYRAYVHAFADGSWSPWDFSEFTLQLEGAARPSVSEIELQPERGRVIVHIQGHDNLLTAQDASLDDDTLDVGSWVRSTGVASVARSEAQALNGTASLLVTCNSTADAFALAADGGAAYATVVGGEYYTALLNVLAFGAPDVCGIEVWLRWLDASKLWLGSAADVHSPTVNSQTGAWQQVAVSGQAPPEAVYASLAAVFKADSTSTRKHYVDEAGIMWGVTNEWSRGGFIGKVRYKVEGSDDAGVTWAALRGASGLVPSDRQQSIVADYESTPYKQRLYRATTLVEV